MKLILFFIISYLILIIQIIESKRCRTVMTDKILDYNLDKTVDHYSTFFNNDNSWIEVIDDDNIMVGGYLEILKSTDRKMPLKAMVRTQYMEQGVWRDGPVHMNKENLCNDFKMPGTFWYNVTGTWSPEFCPPQEGDKWIITNQTVTAVFNVPPSTSTSPWRAYILITQGIPGRETLRVGFGIEIELVDE